ncbi:MAG: MarC family protein [Lentisphaerae bacterium]|nr:MarC family protein [Lentisphaerota bacterium]
MNEQVKIIIENALYFIALLNPASKVMFLSTYEPKLTKKQIFELSWKSSTAALLILITLATFGEIVLSKIFRVELYSLKITGGIVLFMIGLVAIREGHFVNKDEHQKQIDFTDLSLIPLATPLIAGPGIIAAGISTAAQYGAVSVIISLFLGIFINFVIMLFSSGINRVLEKLHLLGPLIRLTGLIISGVAAQMIINGIKESLR